MPVRATHTAGGGGELNAVREGEGFTPLAEKGESSNRSLIGKGSYGSVLEAILRRRGMGEEVVVKVPTIRHWGFHFYRTEMQALTIVRNATPPPHERSRHKHG